MQVIFDTPGCLYAPEMRSPGVVSLAAIQSARDVIAGRVHRTPVLSSAAAAPRVRAASGGVRLAGDRLFLKAEHLQKTGSFKPRGMTARVAALSADERERGIITVSAGNAAQGYAYAGEALGVPVTVVMPTGANRSKVDVVVVGIGGGGLISGIAAAVKGLRPTVRVYGVEPVGSDAISLGLAAGEPVHMLPDSVADGLNAPFAGELPLVMIRALVDDVILIDDATILGGLRFALERMKQVLEPAGAAALAATLSGRVPLRG